MKLHEFSHFIPFIGLAVSYDNTQLTPRLMTLGTRLLEAAIIGGIIMYGNYKIQEQKINYLVQELQEIRKDQKEMKGQIVDVMILQARQSKEAQ